MEQPTTTLNRMPEWKFYNGIEYLEMIITGFKTPEEMLLYYTEGCRMILERPDKSVNVFTDTRGIKISTKTMRKAQEIGKTAQRAIKKSAMIGAPGITVVMLKLYINFTRSPVKFFTNPNIALEYLTKD